MGNLARVVHCLILSLCVASCVNSDNTQCADGRWCPSDTQCWGETTSKCVTSEQIATCEGAADNARCELPDGRNGHCQGALCRICGDHELDPGEVCDDGNNVDRDGCSATCDSDETCGNGIVDLTVREQCDFGARVSGDGCASNCQLETVAWTALQSAGPPLRTDAALAYDEARHQLLLFGGSNETNALGDFWILGEDKHWRQYTGPTPRARLGYLTYDRRNQRTLLFGGYYNVADNSSPENAFTLGDMWAWDGSQWTELQGTTPPARYTPTAYDDARASLVLMGGNVSFNYQNDVWEFKDDAWRAVPITGGGPSPAGRHDHAWVFDAPNNRFILFGGATQSGALLDDTWQLTFNSDDSASWQQLTTTGPAARLFAGMVFDANLQRVVMFGGYNATLLNDGWVLENNQWIEVRDGLRPPARNGPGIVYDPTQQGLLVLGGSANDQFVDDAWLWRGSQWSVLDRPGQPSPRRLASAAYDVSTGRIVLAGGRDDVAVLDDTWEYDGTTWQQQNFSGPTPPRRNAGMTFDGQHVFLYGGRRALRSGEANINTTLADMWRYDGHAHQWTIVDGATPPRRDLTPLATDLEHRRTLLFGGHTGGPIDQQALKDTWLWNGTAWTQATPATTPPERYGHTLVYDARRKRYVMFGGEKVLDIYGTLIAQYDDTWEYYDDDWHLVATPHKPLARSLASMAYDANSGKVVMFGGANHRAVYLRDLCSYDGTDWTCTDNQLPSARDAAQLVYDALHDQLLLHGGFNSGGNLGSMFALRSRSMTQQQDCRATATTDEDGDGTIGSADPDCWPITNPLCPPGTSCTPTTPSCGDGVCWDIERGHCMVDCF